MSEHTSKENAVYFAYGTLLDINHMREFCPSAESLGIMRLKGYRLGFHICGPDPSTGGCTLIEDADNTMYGILYRLSVSDLADLDKASGLDRGLWATKDVTLINDQGENISANTYFIPDPAGEHIPPESYTRPILVGAKAWPLPEDYVSQLEHIVRTSQSA
jgi:hypothetical protein